jgi:hypothetical protein
MSMLVAFPANSHLRSSLELESRLRWKPPDAEERSIRHSYYAINDGPQRSVGKHLHSSGAAVTLSVPRTVAFELPYELLQIMCYMKKYIPSLLMNTSKTIYLRLTCQYVTPLKSYLKFSTLKIMKSMEDIC